MASFERKTILNLELDLRREYVIGAENEPVRSSKRIEGLYAWYRELLKDYTKVLKYLAKKIYKEPYKRQKRMEEAERVYSLAEKAYNTVLAQNNY